MSSSPGSGTGLGAVSRADAFWLEDLRPALEKERVRLVGLDRARRPRIANTSRTLPRAGLPRAHPALGRSGPSVPVHLVPLLNLAALVRDPASGERRFARVKVPPLLPRFVELPDGERFVPIEQVIAAHLEVLFPGMEIVGHSVFRLTRTPTSSSRKTRVETCSRRSSPCSDAGFGARHRCDSKWMRRRPRRFGHSSCASSR